MKRTTGDGNVNNRFFNGDPGLGQPATEVEETWANNVQEELANTVESVGIVLDGGNEFQLLEALNLMIGLGGSAQLKLDPLLNNSLGQDIAGLIFDKTKTKGARVLLDVQRSTDTAENKRNETIELYISFNPFLGGSGEWERSQQGYGNDPELNDTETTLQINPSTGQVTADTTDLTGTNYAGTLRVATINKITL